MVEIYKAILKSRIKRVTGRDLGRVFLVDFINQVVVDLGVF